MNGNLDDLGDADMQGMHTLPRPAQGYDGLQIQSWATENVSGTTTSASEGDHRCHRQIMKASTLSTPPTSRQVEVRVLQVAGDPVGQLVPLVVPLVPLVSKHHHACSDPHVWHKWTGGLWVVGASTMGMRFWLLDDGSSWRWMQDSASDAATARCQHEWVRPGQPYTSFFRQSWKLSKS
jgi:hypothetical protein